MESLRGKVAIIGVGDTEVGIVPHLSASQLCIDAALKALDDAGLTKEDIDGLITCNSFAEPILYHAEAMAEYLQIQPKLCYSVLTGGGTTFSLIEHAAAAIASGVCHTVLISTGDSLRSGLPKEKAMNTQASTGHSQFETPELYERKCRMGKILRERKGCYLYNCL